MRTNIVIDDKLIREAMDKSGFKTKKAVVEEGLKLVIQLHKQASIKTFRGRLKWEGDIEQSRLD